MKKYILAMLMMVVPCCISCDVADKQAFTEAVEMKAVETLPEAKDAPLPATEKMPDDGRRKFTSHDGGISFSYPSDWSVHEQGNMIAVCIDLPDMTWQVCIAIRASELGDYDFDASPANYEELYQGLSKDDAPHQPSRTVSSIRTTTMKCRLGGHNAIRTAKEQILDGKVESSSAMYYVCMKGRMYMIQLSPDVSASERVAMDKILETITFK